MVSFYMKVSFSVHVLQNYIARFGHGSAKLARQAQSKEKTLKKMVDGGLTERVGSDKVFIYRSKHVEQSHLCRWNINLHYDYTQRLYHYNYHSSVFKKKSGVWFRPQQGTKVLHGGVQEKCFQEQQGHDQLYECASSLSQYRFEFIQNMALQGQGWVKLGIKFYWEIFFKSSQVQQGQDQEIFDQNNLGVAGPHEIISMCKCSEFRLFLMDRGVRLGLKFEIRFCIIDSEQMLLI